MIEINKYSDSIYNAYEGNSGSVFVFTSKAPRKMRYMGYVDGIFVFGESPYMITLGLIGSIRAAVKEIVLNER